MFETRHRELQQLLGEISSEGGNLIVTKEFFREKAKYYKVTAKVDVSSSSMNEVSRLPPIQRVVLASTVAHSVGILHRLGIVHGDIKPANVLLKVTEKGYHTAKLIDFDDCFKAGEPAPSEELVVDLAYAAPEANKYLREEGPGEDVTCAADIFALGLIFCQYLTGQKPQFVGGPAAPSGAAPADLLMAGSELSTGLEHGWPDAHKLISSMLAPDFSDRPSIGKVAEELQAIRRSDLTGVSIGASARSSRLKGRLATVPRSTEPKSIRVETGSKALSDATAPSRLRGSLTRKTSKES
ncbi:protein kinase domain-containing protein [Arthrobacter sp. HMWF013]|uniref:protein kinase domain-containing protein n=1 Tax=Arthrobacter sp. HMWF013 TaxID=2056849 RepID=UPI0015E82475|nr:protein kinase [Arthrobacter sp. HMWF013]